MPVTVIFRFNSRSCHLTSHMYVIKFSDETIYLQWRIVKPWPGIEAWLMARFRSWCICNIAAFNEICFFKGVQVMTNFEIWNLVVSYKIFCVDLLLEQSDGFSKWNSLIVLYLFETCPNVRRWFASNYTREIKKPLSPFLE